MDKHSRINERNFIDKMITIENLDDSANLLDTATKMEETLKIVNESELSFEWKWWLKMFVFRKIWNLNTDYNQVLKII